MPRGRAQERPEEGSERCVSGRGTQGRGVGADEGGKRRSFGPVGFSDGMYRYQMCYLRVDYKSMAGTCISTPVRDTVWTQCTEGEGCNLYPKKYLLLVPSKKQWARTRSGYHPSLHNALRLSAFSLHKMPSLYNR